jgi:outer membrane protein TolC
MKLSLEVTCILFAAMAVAALPCSAGAQSAAAEPAPFRLTLKDAIERGLRANLKVLLAGSRVGEAEGTSERRRSLLLPHAQFQIPAAYQTLSLAAQGISIPGLPPVVGPFSTYDFRLSANQALYDPQSYHNWKASKQQEGAARNDLQEARDEIIRQVAGLYLNAESATAQVVAAQSRVDTSESLLKLARDQHDAGIATGIDVVRAQVQFATDRQSLVEARNSAKQALLVLARNIGMRPGTPLELAEALQYRAAEPPSIDTALNGALAGRADYLSLLTQRKALEEQIKASHARYLPRLGVSANYGGIGGSADGFNGTGAIQGSLSVTLFDQDRQGERRELDSRIQGVDQQIADLRLGIEQDIRQALLNLESAADEVKVAQEALDLAQQELNLARDRFKDGLTNNIEVVNAQDSLARAQENSIVALTRHADAQAALALALGNTERIYEPYLGIQ